MDYLVELNKNPTARSMARGLGVTLPVPLKRSRKAWQRRVLEDGSFVVGALRGAQLLPALAGVLAPAGASVIWASEPAVAEPFVGPAEAWAEPLSYRKQPDERDRPLGLVCDATGIGSIAELDQLYELFHPWLRRLQRNGRIVVLARPPAGVEPELDAARQSIEGFIRSLAKELGRKGTRANLLWVEPGAGARLAGPLRFLLSTYSAYITAQPLRISERVRQNPQPDVKRSLVDKWCLVTGAAQGIGAATAQSLAREGARVLIVDRPGSESKGSRLAREIGGDYLALDIAALAARETLTQRVRELGGMDVVVHNAGVTRDKTLGRMGAEAWQLVLNVNLKAVVTLTRALVEQDLLKPSGRIIALSSVGGIAGNAGQTNYACSKAGLIGYVRSLADELAPRGVTVNAIAPGLIETQMTARMPFAIREAARRLSALGQGGTPKDVAEAITFFASPSSDGVTGAVLRVCGGALIGA